MSDSGRVFISYCSEDWPMVRPFIEALERRGVSIWVDRSMVRPGDPIPDSLEEGMAECAGALLFVSRDYLRKAWTIAERRYFTWRAISKGDIKVVPVRLDDCELPAFLAPLRREKETDSESMAEFFATFLGGRVPLRQPSQVIDNYVGTLTDTDLLRLLESFFKSTATNGSPASLPFRARRISVTIHFLDPLPPLVREDLQGKKKLLEIHRRFAQHHAETIAGGGLGIFQPAFELQLERENEQAQSSIAQLRNCLNEIIDYVSKAEM